MSAYYNEHDPYAAQWLRNLVAAGHIAPGPGEVDERNILDVKPDDLRGFVQCHFFAGIGVWSYALRRAGWPDDRAVWTGSCPCQPFSSAGMARGFADERHLWPFFHFLIEERRPRVVFGEQVASKDGLAWLDLVHADMEGAGYAFAAVDLCAAGVGAPHIRQRLWFVGEDGMADSSSTGLAQRERDGRVQREEVGFRQGEAFVGLGDAGGVEHCACDGREQRRAEPEGRCLACGCSTGGLADSLDGAGHGSQPRGIIRELPQGVGALQTECRPTGPVNGHWREADWLLCRDGKWRPVEPGTFPLAHGAPARVGRLRAYGNAIVATQAQEFVAAYLECRP